MDVFTGRSRAWKRLNCGGIVPGHVSPASQQVDFVGALKRCSRIEKSCQAVLTAAHEGMPTYPVIPIGSNGDELRPHN
jgi:hypothetical protein